MCPTNRMEGKEAVNEVRERIKRIKPDLTIYRVPKKTLIDFKQMAKEDFEDDYGMLLKYLFESTRNDEKINILFAVVQELEKDVESLMKRDGDIEDKDDEKEPVFKMRKMLGGNKIKVPQKEE